MYVCIELKIYVTLFLAVNSKPRFLTLYPAGSVAPPTPLNARKARVVATVKNKARNMAVDNARTFERFLKGYVV